MCGLFDNVPIVRLKFFNVQLRADVLNGEANILLRLSWEALPTFSPSFPRDSSVQTEQTHL